MNDALTTTLDLSPSEIFSQLPPRRVGEPDRRYLNEVLEAGFRNTEDPADIFTRLESAFAERFGVRYAILHNSGTGTMQSCLLAAGVGPGDEVDRQQEAYPEQREVEAVFIERQVEGNQARGRYQQQEKPENRKGHQGMFFPSYDGQF